MTSPTYEIVFGGRRRQVDFDARTTGAAAPTPAALLLAHATCLGFLSLQTLRATLYYVLAVPFKDKVGVWAHQVTYDCRGVGPLRLVAYPTDPETQVGPLLSSHPRHTY